MTNGVASTQYNRLKLLDLNKYFKDIFISEEIGYQNLKLSFLITVLDILNTLIKIKHLLSVILLQVICKAV